MNRLAFFIPIVLVAALAQADIGPYPPTKAEATARRFLKAATLPSSQPCLYQAIEFDGTHEFLFGEKDGLYGGIARVSVCSWNGEVISFTNHLSATARRKPLPKGHKRQVTTDDQATRQAQYWADRIGLPQSARIPGKPQFGRKAWVSVQVREKAPHGYEFFGGFPEFATFRIDVVDGALYEFHLYPRRIVESWTLKVKPKDLQGQAIAAYRQGLIVAKEKPTTLPPKVEVGYTMNPAKSDLYDPGKGRRVHYKVLGVRFTFPTSGEMGMKDWVEFDAGTGKLLKVWIAERHHHERAPPPNKFEPKRGK